MSRQREAERQRGLLAALFAADPALCSPTDRDAVEHAGFAEPGERLQRGLRAYRANAAGIAERALAAAYPTVSALIGAPDGAALARALWRASPPRRGDLAQWAQDLPEFIEGLRDLDPWPYLADCARLDAAVLRCESATDAEMRPDTLALLAEHPPQRLVLRLLPSVGLLASDWPVATLHAAHAAGPPDAGAAERRMNAARVALAERRAESVVIARSGWRALAQAVDASTFAWMRSLRTGANLAEALARAGTGFDFSAWLLQALQRQWIAHAALVPVAPAPDMPTHRSTFTGSTT
jgi:hypothetical protein